MASAPQIEQAAPLNFKIIEAGISLEAISEFSMSSGMKLMDICDIVIPARTLKHRRTRREALTRDESDKLARLIRVFNFAVKVFGNPDKALRWLSKPKQRFEERTPLHMLRTEFGGRMVEELIGQIDEGMFA